MEGTYSLPEAQLDRFLMRISLGHLDPEDELAVIRGHSAGRTVEHPRPVMDVRAIQHLIGMASQVRVSDMLAKYAVALVGATRQHPHVRHGRAPVPRWRWYGPRGRGGGLAGDAAAAPGVGAGQLPRRA
jgi:MoxR-like ATPase